MDQALPLTIQLMAIVRLAMPKEGAHSLGVWRAQCHASHKEHGASLPPCLTDFEHRRPDLSAYEFTARFRNMVMRTLSSC